MKETMPGRIFRYLLYTGMVGAAGVTAVIYVTSTRLFLYPAATITLALFISSLLVTYEVSLSLPTVKFDHRFVDISLLLAIAVLGVYTGPRRGFPQMYFVLILVASLLLAYRIFSVNGYTNLLYILALGTVIRANVWFSAPHFSKDPRIHVGITGFIRETGRMVPFRIDDYHDYPIADIYSGITAIVTGLNAKHALFLSLGFAGVLAIFFVYIFVRRLFEEEQNRMAGYAAFLFSMSAFTIGLAAGPKPQTLSATLFTVAIFGTQLHSKANRTIIVAFLGGVMVFTHILAPLVLAVVLLLYYGVSVIVGEFKMKYRSRDSSVRHTTAFLLGIVTLVMILQRYHEVGHFRLQLSRIFGAFLPSGGSATSFVYGGGKTTSTHILLDVDNLLLQAGNFLIGGLLTGVAGITYLYDRVLHTEREVLQDEWAIVSFLVYSGFSIVFFTQASQARRTAVALLAVTAPALVYSLYRIERRWNDVGRIAIIVLLVSGTFFGIARPGVYKIQRTSGFVPALYGPDIAAIDHFSTYSVDTNAGPAGYTDGYTSLSAYFEQVEDGYDTGRYEYSTERLVGVRMLLTNQSQIGQFLAGDSSPVFIYRTYYEGFAGVKPPPEADVIYSSGETKMLS